MFDSLNSNSNSIISAETISSNFTQDEAESLRYDLEAIGYQKFVIVIYVRDPADFYLSRLQQNLRSRYEEYMITPSAFTYGVSQLVQLWESVYPGCLQIRKYPPNPYEDITSDFRDLVQQHLGITLRPTEIRSNETLSAESMKVLQDYRLLYDTPVMPPDHQKLVNHLQALKSGIAQSKPILKKEVAHHIRARHQEDFKFLRSRYHIQFDWLDDTLTTSEKYEDLFRIEELVERCDGETVIRLLLSIIRLELSRPQPVGIQSRILSKIRAAIGWR
jgi:hypothetical protein